MSQRRQRLGYIVAQLTHADMLALTYSKPVTGSGGRQSLIRRLQAGVKGNSIKIEIDDIARIARHWWNTGLGNKPGCGGWQRRLPVNSLRDYLPTMAPMFRDEPGSGPRKCVVWVYFIREAGTERIKIGQTTDRGRRGGGRRTDNSREMQLLLWTTAPPEWTGQPDHYFHHKFSRYRIEEGQEWFWYHDKIREFVREESAKQELQKQRRGADAAVVGRESGFSLEAERKAS